MSAFRRTTRASRRAVAVAAAHRRGRTIPVSVDQFQPAPSPSGKAEVCKTSIPGSNPGGASKFSVQVRSFVPQQHNQRLAIGLRWTTNRRSAAPSVDVTADSASPACPGIQNGWRSRGPPPSPMVMVSHSPFGIAGLQRLRAADVRIPDGCSRDQHGPGIGFRLLRDHFVAARRGCGC